MSGLGIGISDVFLEHLGTGDIIVIAPPDPPIIEINTLTLTLPVPDHTKSGDLLIALISTDGNPTITPPAGWTLEDSIGGTAKSFIYWRAATDSEPANYTWTLDGAEDAVGSILRLTKADTIYPINAKVKNSGNNSIIPIPAITTTVRKTMLITLISLNDGVLINLSTLKNAKQVSLWVVNTSGAAIGSVGSSASYKTINKAGIRAAYNLQTQGLVVTDYYAIQIAINPIGEGTAPPVIPFYDAYVYLHDLKGSGVDGGASVAGSWETRDITNEVEDTAGICTLAANQITLDAGTYRCQISAPAYRSDQQQLRLYNITDGALELVGASSWNEAAAEEAQTRAFVAGRFTIAAQKVFEIQHRVDNSRAADGHGVAVDWGDCIYATAEFWREA